MVLYRGLEIGRGTYIIESVMECRSHVRYIVICAHMSCERWLQVNPLGTAISGWAPCTRDRHGDEDVDVSRLWVGRHPLTMEEWVEEGQV